MNYWTCRFWTDGGLIVCGCCFQEDKLSVKMSSESKPDGFYLMKHLAASSPAQRNDLSRLSRLFSVNRAKRQSETQSMFCSWISLVGRLWSVFSWSCLWHEHKLPHSCKCEIKLSSVWSQSVFMTSLIAVCSSPSRSGFIFQRPSWRPSRTLTYKNYRDGFETPGTTLTFSASRASEHVAASSWLIYCEVKSFKVSSVNDGLKYGWTGNYNPPAASSSSAATSVWP